MAPTSCLLLLAAWMMAATSVPAQEATDATQAKLGKVTFQEYCRSCHGDTAKGDGPVGEYLTPKPADLTLISKRNGGVFPSEAVNAAITGGKKVKGHGNSEMPVWGEAFRKVRAGQTEEEVKARISQLVLYLSSIQVEASPSP